MAFRGHRDDEKHDDMSSNCGNFRALLNYRVNGGNEALKAHCECAPKNATYKSKTTQSELINIIGDIILKRIVADINQAGGWYSVSADDVRDTSNKEQLAVTLHFCEANGKSHRKHGSGQRKVGNILMGNFLSFHGKHDKFIGRVKASITVCN